MTAAFICNLNRLTVRLCPFISVKAIRCASPAEDKLSSGDSSQEKEHGSREPVSLSMPAPLMEFKADATNATQSMIENCWMSMGMAVSF